MTEKYLIWLENGVTTIAKITSETGTLMTVRDPHFVVNLQYGVKEDGSITSPNDPASVKSRFNVEMTPCLFKEFTNDKNTFSINTNMLKVYSIFDDQTAPIITQYNQITESLTK